MNNNELKETVIKSTIVIVFVTVLAKFAAFISTATLAYFLGTTEQSDALNTIYSVDSVFYPMLGTGVWKVFLPLYKEKVVNNKMQDADRLANKVITLFALLSAILVAVIFIFSKQIVWLLAPGYSADTRELASRLIRISSPMYFFIISGAIYAAMLQCHNKFFASQIREAVTHIPVILTAILLYHQFGIFAIAVSIMVGYSCRLFIELPFVDWGYHYKIDFDFHNSEMVQMLRRYPSAMLSEGANQINVLVDKIMASMLTIGSVSALNYAYKLFVTLNGILSVGVSNALYPQIILLKETNREKDLHRIICRVINMFSFIMIPITVGGLFFSEEVVSIVYKRGVFDSNSVEMTSGAFACYCLGLFFIATNVILINIFYAYGDTSTPLRLSSINLFSNIVLNLFFVQFFEVSGLALATSVSSVLQFVLVLIFLRKIIVIQWIDIRKSLSLAILFSLVSCMVAKTVCDRLASSALHTLGIAVILSAVIYLALAVVFKMEELHFVIDNILKKVFNNK